MTGPLPPAALARRLAPALVTAAALAAFGWYFWGQREYIAGHYAFRPWLWLAMAGLVLVSLGLRGLANQRLFERLGVSASYRDWVALVSVNSFSNYLPLSAGLVAKAVYLKRVHAMPYGAFALGQLALLLLVVATNGAAGLITVALWRPAEAGWIALAFSAMSATAALLWLPPAATRWIARRWTSWDADAVRAVRRSAPVVAALQVGFLLTTALGLKLGFAMGSADAGVAACVVFSAATVVTRLVSITPGSIGVRELVVGGLAVLTGFELQDALIASTVARLAEMAVIFVLGGAFTYTLSERVAATFSEQAARERGRSLEL